MAPSLFLGYVPEIVLSFRRRAYLSLLFTMFLCCINSFFKIRARALALCTFWGHPEHGLGVFLGSWVPLRGLEGVLGFGGRSL